MNGEVITEQDLVDDVLPYSLSLFIFVQFLVSLEKGAALFKNEHVAFYHPGAAQFDLLLDFELRFQELSLCKVEGLQRVVSLSHEEFTKRNVCDTCLSQSLDLTEEQLVDMESTDRFPLSFLTLNASDSSQWERQAFS